MKTLKIVFRHKENAKQELKESLKEVLAFDYANAKEATEMVMVFDSFDRFKKEILNRLELLTKIKMNHPHSIYALAKMVEKSQPATLSDCNELEDLGLICFEKEEHNGRTVIRPVLEFNFDVIDIEGLWEIKLKETTEEKVAA